MEDYFFNVQYTKREGRIEIRKARMYVQDNWEIERNVRGAFQVLYQIYREAEYNSEPISNKLTDAICLAPHSIDIVEQCQCN